MARCDNWKKPEISQLLEDQIVSDYQAGMTVTDIEEKFKTRSVTRGHIRGALNRNGIERRSRSREPKSDFTPQEAGLVYAVKRDGISPKVAAQVRGYSLSAAETILARAKELCFP